MCLFLPALAFGASEYGGRWDDESKAKVCWKLIENLRTEQIERKAKLSEHFDDLAPDLNFANFPSEQGADGERLKERFLAGRLRSSKADEFMASLHKNLQANQDLLYEAEKNAAQKWKLDSESVESEKEHTAKIFGNDVTAIRLGVILDSSPSMKDVIPKLRESIAEKFHYSYFVEVAKCSLGKNLLVAQGFGRETSIDNYNFHGCPWFFADPPKRANPFEEKWHSPRDLKSLSTVESCYPVWPSLTRTPSSAFSAMINLLETDTIYWFSDFKDKVNEGFVKALCREMRKRKIRLYLVSNSKKPHELLITYAEISGGSYEKERVR